MKDSESGASTFSNILGWAVLLALVVGGLYSYGYLGSVGNVGTEDPLGPGSTMVAETGSTMVAEDSLGADSVAADSADSPRESSGKEQPEGTEVASQEPGSASGRIQRANRPQGDGGSGKGRRSSSERTRVSGGSEPNTGGTSDEQSGGRTVDKVENPQAYVPPQERIEQFYSAVASQGDRWAKQLDTLREDAARWQDKLDDSPSISGSGTTAEELSIGLGNSRKDQYDNLILEKAREYEIDPLALKVIIAVESSFRSEARASSTTAAGLTQVVAPTFRALYPQFKNFSDARVQQYLMDPEHAIDAGARYYAERVAPKASTLRRVFYQYYLGHSAIEEMIKPGEEGPVIKNHKKSAARYAQRAMRKYQKWADRLDYTYPPEESGDSASIR